MNTPFPIQRTVVGVDIEGSTDRNNTQRARMREALYEVLEKSLIASGVTEEHREPLVDRGDGAIALIQPVDVLPKTLLVNTFIPVLREELRAQELRLRVAMHYGDVHYDNMGPFGEDIDLMVRLLDASELRTRLRKSAGPLVLTVSERFYRSVVKHGYDGIDAGTFQALTRFRMGGQSHRGWVQE
jgi:class 3 adenylate cyclase